MALLDHVSMVRSPALSSLLEQQQQLQSFSLHHGLSASTNQISGLYTELAHSLGQKQQLIASVQQNSAGGLYQRNCRMAPISLGPVGNGTANGINRVQSMPDYAEAVVLRKQFQEDKRVKALRRGVHGSKPSLGGDGTGRG